LLQEVRVRTIFIIYIDFMEMKAELITGPFTSSSFSQASFHLVFSIFHLNSFPDSPVKRILGLEESRGSFFKHTGYDGFFRAESSISAENNDRL